MMNQTDIEHIFSFHPPKDQEIAQLHDSVRREVKLTASFFMAELPDSAEKTLAIRHLQQAMMYANAAIAIHS